MISCLLGFPDAGITKQKKRGGPAPADFTGLGTHALTEESRFVVRHDIVAA